MGKIDTYRPCVVGVFIDETGKLLLGKRFGNEHWAISWQLPQGGIEEGEKAEEALFREMREEVGQDQFDIISKADRLVHYDFPADLRAPIALKYKGQSQHWFLCRFHQGSSPDLAKAIDKEFSELKWESLVFCLDQIIPFKRQAYIEGLSLLGFSLPK